VDRWGIDFEATLAEGTWSSGGRCHGEIAGSLFNGSLRPNLDWAFGILSVQWAEVAIEAMQIRAELPDLRVWKVLIDASCVGMVRARNETGARMKAWERFGGESLRGIQVELDQKRNDQIQRLDAHSGRRSDDKATIPLHDA
jgi:hypothetical protein